MKASVCNDWLTDWLTAVWFVSGSEIPVAARTLSHHAGATNSERWCTAFGDMKSAATTSFDMSDEDNLLFAWMIDWLLDDRSLGDRRDTAVWDVEDELAVVTISKCRVLDGEPDWLRTIVDASTGWRSSTSADACDADDIERLIVDNGLTVVVMVSELDWLRIRCSWFLDWLSDWSIWRGVRGKLGTDGNTDAWAGAWGERDWACNWLFVTVDVSWLDDDGRSSWWVIGWLCSLVMWIDDLAEDGDECREDWREDCRDSCVSIVLLDSMDAARALRFDFNCWCFE